MNPALAHPRVIPFFPARWYGPETPQSRAALRVVRVEKPANARFTSTDAHDDLSVERERRRGNGVTGRVLRDVDLPSLHAGSSVERDQTADERSDVHGSI